MYVPVHRVSIYHDLTYDFASAKHTLVIVIIMSLITETTRGLDALSVVLLLLNLSRILIFCRVFILSQLFLIGFVPSDGPHDCYRGRGREKRSLTQGTGTRSGGNLDNRGWRRGAVSRRGYRELSLGTLKKHLGVVLTSPVLAF